MWIIYSVIIGKIGIINSWDYSIKNPNKSPREIIRISIVGTLIGLPTIFLCISTILNNE